MTNPHSGIRHLAAGCLLALSLSLPALAQPHAVPNDTSGLLLVPSQLVPARGGSFYYLSKPTHPASPCLSTAARAAACPVYLLPWGSASFLVDDSAIAVAAMNVARPSLPTASATSSNGGSSGSSLPAFVPPTGYAPCDTTGHCGSPASRRVPTSFT